MSELTPGVYVYQETGELAVAAPIAMNIVGIVGTASKGPVDSAVLINSIQQAYEIYGYPDAFDESTQGQELTLTRALALVYDAGGQGCWVVRVASATAASATRDIDSATGYAATLSALTEGTWGNDIRYKVENADGVTATAGHVALHGAFYQASYTVGLSNSSPFSFLAVTHAPTFIAETSAGNKIEITYSSGTGSNIVMKIIHSDAYVFKTSGEIDGDIVNATTDRICQTFTTRDACKLEGVNFRMDYDVAVPNPAASLCQVQIFAIDSNHKPTGSALATGSDTFTNLALGSSYSSEYIALSASLDLTANTEYAIVLSWSGTYTSGDFQLGGLEAPTATPTYTRGYAWFSADSGSTWTASSAVETNLFYPKLTINENYCVFVINAWGTAWPTENTGNKYIIWSSTSTPTGTTYVDVDFYTSSSMQVTIRYGGIEEKYWVLDGFDLIADINAGSLLVSADTPATSDQRDEPPAITAGGWQYFGLGGGTMGANGATDIAASDFDDGFDELLKVDAHVITAAGRSDDAVIAKLLAHVTNASENKKERIAVAGHRVGISFADVLTSNGAFADKRLSWYSPGVKRTNPSTGTQETLPAAYMAAYAAGFLASNEPATSILYKPAAVEGLETNYTETEVEQLIGKRIVPVSLLTEGGRVFRHHINTSIDQAVSRTTVVRITDYATRALRSVCNGFIGKKNLSSRRAAIQVVTEGAFEKMKNLSMLNDSNNAYSVAVSMPDLFTVQVDCSFTPVGTIEVVRIRQTVRGV
jgi:hypothetical protein